MQHRHIPCILFLHYSFSFLFVSCGHESPAKQEQLSPFYLPIELTKDTLFLMSEPLDGVNQISYEVKNCLSGYSIKGTLSKDTPSIPLVLQDKACKLYISQIVMDSIAYNLATNTVFKPNIGASNVFVSANAKKITIKNINILPSPATPDAPAYKIEWQINSPLATWKIVPDFNLIDLTCSSATLKEGKKISCTVKRQGSLKQLKTINLENFTNIDSKNLTGIPKIITLNKNSSSAKFTVSLKKNINVPAQSTLSLKLIESENMKPIIKEQTIILMDNTL